MKSEEMMRIYTRIFGNLPNTFKLVRMFAIREGAGRIYHTRIIAVVARVDRSVTDEELVGVNVIDIGVDGKPMINLTLSRVFRNRQAALDYADSSALSGV